MSNTTILAPSVCERDSGLGLVIIVDSGSFTGCLFQFQSKAFANIFIAGIRMPRLITTTVTKKRLWSKLRRRDDFSALNEIRARLLRISLCDFVAYIASTHGASNSCKRFAIATTNLVAQQSPDSSPHPNSDRAVLRNWCLLLCHRHRPHNIVLRCLRLRCCNLVCWRLVRRMTNY